MSNVGELDRVRRGRAMIVYLSGPMRGHPQDNWPAFIDATEQLRAAGYDVLSPAEHTMEMGFDPRLDQFRDDFDIRAALAWDCAAVLRSDAVVVLDGWQGSRGACAEVALAQAAGIDVRPLRHALAEGADCPPGLRVAGAVPDVVIGMSP